MKWSLAELRKNQNEPLQFDISLDLKSELQARDRQILDSTSVHVIGFVLVEPNDYLLHYQVQTTVTVPSTRSLAPVALDLDFNVDEIFMTPEQFQKESSESEEILVLEDQTLDLDDSVTDNILLQIPMQVLTAQEKESEEMPHGNDWRVISEEEYQRQKEEKEQNTIDPRLANLSNFFEDDPEENEDK